QPPRDPEAAGEQATTYEKTPARVVTVLSARRWRRREPWGRRRWHGLDEETARVGGGHRDGQAAGEEQGEEACGGQAPRRDESSGHFGSPVSRLACP
uniref:Uncharacterized protein n=1 Tax=Triticum urartu TaxID=4572 RepID=A0A8R7Q2J6_TRIUA